MPVIERAIATERATLPPNDPELARAIINLAQISRVQKHYDQALPLFEEARHS